jgi:membrane-bound ClpP family serine protease
MWSNFILTASFFAVAFPALVMLFFLMKLVIHSRRIKMSPDTGNLIGMTGRAESDIADEGLVFVRGELWPARSELKIKRGKRVRVIGCSSLKLEVEIG